MKLGLISDVHGDPLALELAWAHLTVLGADRIVVEISTKPSGDDPDSVSDEHVDLAMTEQALTGFLAWLEASPPGSHLGDFS